LTSC